MEQASGLPVSYTGGKQSAFNFAFTPSITHDVGIQIHVQRIFYTHWIWTGMDFRQTGQTPFEGPCIGVFPSTCGFVHFHKRNLSGKPGNSESWFIDKSRILKIKLLLHRREKMAVDENISFMWSDDKTVTFLKWRNEANIKVISTSHFVCLKFDWSSLNLSCCTISSLMV